MDDHDTEMVGDYCESVFGHHIFQVLCANFKQAQLDKFQSTAPNQTEVREEAYHTLRGADEFLCYMKSFIDQRDSIGKERKQHQQLAEEAGLTDLSPDDEVLLGDDLRFEP